MLDQALNADLYSLAGYPTATSIVESDSCAAEFFAMTGAVPHDRFYRKLGYRRDMHVLTQPTGTRDTRFWRGRGFGVSLNALR